MNFAVFGVLVTCLNIAYGFPLKDDSRPQIIGKPIEVHQALVDDNPASIQPNEGTTSPPQVNLETTMPTTAEAKTMMPVVETTMLPSAHGSQATEATQPPQDSENAIQAVETTQKTITTGSSQDVVTTGASMTTMPVTEAPMIRTTQESVQEVKMETTNSQIQTTLPTTGPSAVEQTPSALGQDQTTTGAMKATESTQEVKPAEENSQAMSTTAPESTQAVIDITSPQATFSTFGTTKSSQVEVSAEAVDSVEETAPPVKATKAPAMAKPKQEGKSALTSPTTQIADTKKDSAANALGVHRILIILSIIFLMY